MSKMNRPIAPNAPITNALLTNGGGFHKSSDARDHLTIKTQSTKGGNIGHYYKDGSVKMFDGGPGAWLVK